MTATADLKFYDENGLSQAIPNPDGFETDEMGDLAAETRAIAAVLVQIANYAEARQMSGYLRKKGEINRALELEQHADSIWAGLPQWAKW